MLQPGNTEKFLDGLSIIPGVRRVLVHGPGHVMRSDCYDRSVCTPQLPRYAEVNIANHDVKLHVLTGDVIVETVDETVFDTVSDFCSYFFDDIAYQIFVGKFMKSSPTLSDYLNKRTVSDTDFIGLSDSREGINPVVIRIDKIDSCIAS